MGGYILKIRRYYLFFAMRIFIVLNDSIDKIICTMQFTPSRFCKVPMALLVVLTVHSCDISFLISIQWN